MAEKKAPARKSTAKKSTSRRRDTGQSGGDDPSPGHDVETHDERDGATPGEVHTAYIALASGRYQPVQYEVVGGDAVVEADIVLGTVEEVERESELIKAEMRGELAAAVLITGDQFRWPDCTVPFTIDPSLPDQARVIDAIQHWEDNTAFRFVERTAANAAQHPDWVTFRPNTGCSSAVGRRGGQQFINLATGCTLGNTIHEIGHAVGFWHEQSREDRDAFVTIHWENIIPGRENNFSQRITDGDDVGAYDYGSIMHYPRTAFSQNGQDTITPTNPPTAQIGQRVGLSAGDVAAANSMCPAPKPRIETVKELTKEFAPETVKELSPETTKKLTPETIKERFPETTKELSPETTKERFPETTKELSPETAKERFPETIKELSPETAKERFPETIKELSPETAKERAPEPPVTWVEHLRPGAGPVVNPAVGGTTGGALPFAVRTPHRGSPADAGAATERAALEAEAAALADAYVNGEADLRALGEAYEAAVARLAELDGV